MHLPSLVLLGLAAGSQGMALARQTEAVNCTLPTWTFGNFTALSNENIQIGGRADFTLSNSLTNKTDKITCPLRANYRCNINGIPSDKSVKIDIQVNLNVATLVIDHKVYCKDGHARDFVAQAEFELDCPEPTPGQIEYTCTGGSGEAVGYVVDAE